MDEPNRFERPLVDLSTRFTGVAAEAVDREVERALHVRVELLATDRTTLFEFSPDGTALRATHAWARRGPSWSVVSSRQTGATFLTVLTLRLFAHFAFDIVSYSCGLIRQLGALCGLPAEQLRKHLFAIPAEARIHGRAFGSAPPLDARVRGHDDSFLPTRCSMNF